HMLTEIGVRPLREFSIVKPDATAKGRPDAGQHVGYLPQDVALLDATIEENISRLEPEVDARAIVDAAQITGIHEMIV
ncbi:type I secretion system permease/ATPase, partial [Rhizobium leguminosarum]